MPLEPQTFRDHTLSLFQSAIEAVARAKAQPGAARPGLENNMVRAATQVASFAANNMPLPQQAPKISPTMPGKPRGWCFSTCRRGWLETTRRRTL